MSTLTIAVTVTDAAGQVATASVDVPVTDPPPQPAGALPAADIAERSRQRWNQVR